MKKVLVLAYDFPPYNSIGAQRPASWLKYFPDNNVDITIVTRHWDDDIQSPIDYIKPSKKQQEQTEEINYLSRIIRVPFNPNIRDRIILKFGLDNLKIIRKLISIFISYFRFIIPSIDKGTYPVFNAAKKYLEKNKVDLIIATGEPFVLFKYAAMLGNIHKTPWAADYRDCWNKGPLIDNSSIMQQLIGRFFLNIEQSVVRSAKFISTPSPTYKKPLSRLFPEKEVHIIYNGHDIENNDTLNKIEPNKEIFTIAYAGIIYPHQRLETFLDGVIDFIQSHPQIKIRLKFYGLNFYPKMVDRLCRYNKNLSKIIDTTDRIPYKEVVLKLKEAHVLLLLSNKGANWLNAKVFDYLALKKPILLVKNDKGILEKILDSSGVGYKTSNSNDVKNQLEMLYANFFQGNMSIIDEQNMIFYSRENQANIFCGIINKL